MQWPSRIPDKLYLALFTWFCLGDLLILLTPASDVSIYYHTLAAFQPRTSVLYILAVLRAMVNAFAVIAVADRAFGNTRDRSWFFFPMFWIRIFLELAGHHYEFQTIKAAGYSISWSGGLAICIYLAFMFPSYQAHALAAFKKPGHTLFSGPTRFSR